MEPLIRADVEGNYLDEVSSRALYLTLADLDDLPARATLWRSLADFEERHAASWERLLREAGYPVPRAQTACALSSTTDPPCRDAISRMTSISQPTPA